MTRRVILLLGLLVMLLQSPAEAEIKNSALDSLIQAALANNPDLQAAGFRQQAAEKRQNYAGWIPDPKLSVGIMNLPRTSWSFDETPMSAVVVGLSQMIPWPGKLSSKSSIARLDSEGRQLDRAIVENAVVRQVKHSYFDYTYWRLAGEILEQNQGLIRNIVDVAETNYANGVSSAQDFLRSQTALARLENRLLKADQMRQSALTTLGWLTDDPETVTADLASELPEIEDSGTDQSEAVSSLSSPAIEKAAVSSTIADKKVDLAGQAYWPDLTFGIDYSIRKNTPMDPVRGEDFLTFKFGLNLPLWFFARQKNQSAEARLSLEAARAHEHSVVSNVDRRVNDTRLVLKSLRDRLVQYDISIIPQASAAAEAAGVAYEVGQVDFNGYLMAQLEVMNIELERLDLLRQYHQSLAALDELTGVGYGR